VEISRVPEVFRGYGPLKDARLAAAKAKEAQLLAQWRNPLHIELAA
jgi:indolepyruvate ferredoxin oxidoreductase